VFAFAFAANLHHDDPSSNELGRMLDAWPHAAPDSLGTVSSARAAAGLLRWTVLDRDRTAAPIWDSAAGRLFVGDVRLYNREEICRSLAISSNDRSDSEIVWLGYGRWGRDVVDHLCGDFSFVVWDEKHRQLFAARDHFGIRPLYFRVEPERVFVASDVAQILAVAGQRLRVDGRSVVDLLVGPARSHQRTFFEGIDQLPAGHTLLVSESSRHQQRYWRPAPDQARSLGYAERCARIRDLFSNAVRTRLESQRPIVAHSSGGFDSSVILMLADRMYAEDPSRPPLIMASAIAPGMGCDDEPYMDVVARNVRFEGIRWNALESRGYGLDDQVLASPGVRTGIGGAEERDLNLADDRGARILMSGVLGDTVVHANGVMRDMLRGGRWREALRFTVGNRRSPAPGRLLMRSLLGFLSPERALRILERYKNRSARQVPAWAGPRAREMFPLPPPEVDVLGASSHVAVDLWARLTGPGTARVIETAVAYGTRRGIEVRLPFTDRRLIEAVLQVPWEDRMPNGDARRLGRDALGTLLPQEFAARGDQGSWLPVFVRQARAFRPAIGALFDDGEWVSAPYVDRSAARRMYHLTETAGENEGDDVITLTCFGTLEAWLRRVRGSIDCDI
jgi:asparagine synthase (glutamine-hydrolysing)